MLINDSGGGLPLLRWHIQSSRGGNPPPDY